MQIVAGVRRPVQHNAASLRIKSGLTRGTLCFRQRVDRVSSPELRTDRHASQPHFFTLF